MSVRYEVIGAAGISRHRSAASAVSAWRRRRRSEANERDGTRPYLDQVGGGRVVRLWSEHPLPPHVGPALLRALEAQS